MTNSLHKTIKELRLANNYSQDFIATKLFISRPTYMLVEKGERDLTIPEAQTLVNIFGMSIEDLISGKKPSTVEVVLEKNKAKKSAESSNKNIRISVPQEKVEKFKVVVGYILEKIGGKPNVGMTVLYKLLYFIDFDYYELFEDQLIGAVYIKNHFGPTPVMFSKVVEQMIKDGEVEVIRSKFYKKDQKKYLVNPSYSPDLKVLSAQEIKHIDKVLEKYSNKTAKELTECSHKDVPWITAEEGKQLDYEAVFYRTDETSVRKYGSD